MTVKTEIAKLERECTRLEEQRARLDPAAYGYFETNKALTTEIDSIARRLKQLKKGYKDGTL